MASAILAHDIHIAIHDTHGDPGGGGDGEFDPVALNGKDLDSRFGDAECRTGFEKHFPQHP